MSQTMRITEINGAFYPEIFTSFPDRDDAIALIEYAVKDAWLSPSDEYEVRTAWYEIGEGECNSDTIFTDETLIDWYNNGGVSEIIRQAKERGYEVEHIQTDTICIDADDIDELIEYFEEFGN